MSLIPRVGKLVLPRTALLLCDLQEKFRSQIAHFDAITQVCGRMLQAAKILGIRTVVTEMYPKGECFLEFISLDRSILWFACETVEHILVAGPFASCAVNWSRIDNFPLIRWSRMKCSVDGYRKSSRWSQQLFRIFKCSLIDNPIFFTSRCTSVTSCQTSTLQHTDIGSCKLVRLAVELLSLYLFPGQLI